MEWCRSIVENWEATLIWVVGLTLVFGLLGRWSPCNPGRFWWTNLRSAATDFVYWFIVPLFLRLGRTLLAVAVVLLLFGGREPTRAPLTDWPLWQAALAALLIQDLFQYWSHRLFHSRLAWRFHAIHHAPEVLDWTAAARFHPVNNLLTFGLADVIVLLLGCPPAALVALAPINIAYSAMVHANLDWTFGPLRYLFASPVFHRWHHTTQEEGRDKNFASTFPLLDLMFGTFYMPPQRLPDSFGNGDPGFPVGFWGQFLHPFAPGWARRIPLRASFTSLGLVVGAILVTASFFPDRPTADEPPTEQAAPTHDLVVHTTEHSSGAVLGVALSADGRFIASGDDTGAVKVWDAATADVLHAQSLHSRPVRCVALSADGGRVVSVSLDGTIKIWTLATGDVAVIAGPGGPIFSVCLSADGRKLVAGGLRGMVRIYDAATGREEQRFSGDPGAVLAVAVSGDGGRVVATNNWTAKIWDAVDGREQATLEGHTDLVAAVALAPDGRTVYTAGYDGTLRAWNAATGAERHRLTAHDGPVTSLALSPDGRRLATAGRDGAVKLWEASSGAALLTLPGVPDGIASVAVGVAGGRIVAGARNGALQVWDAPRSGPRDAAE